MSTLIQIRDKVKIDAGVEKHPKFPNSRLNRMISEAQRYVQIKLVGLGMKKWETEQNISAGLVSSTFKSGTNNVKTVAIGTTYLPNLLESPDSVPFILVNDGTDYGIAYPIDKDKFDEQISNTYLTPSVSEAVFMRLSGKIYLAPVSITVAVAHYYKALDDLVNDIDVISLPIEYEDMLIKKVVADINEILGKLNDKVVASQELDKELKEIFERFRIATVQDVAIERSDNVVLQ